MTQMIEVRWETQTAGEMILGSLKIVVQPALHL